MLSGLVIAAAAAAAWTTAAAPTAEIPRTTITVRVYRAVELPSAVEQRALAEAETALRAALIDVRWRLCVGPSPGTVCDEPVESSELVLQIVHHKDPRPVPSAVLGSALLAAAGGSVMATVYLNRVVRTSKAAGLDAGVLLGRVAAHELGHLMIGTRKHPRHGLMRPHWTLSEIRQNRAADWMFTAGDAAAMRQQVLLSPAPLRSP